MPDKDSHLWALGKMAEFERAISALYATFAEELPGEREFWQSLSAEEEQHAGWLEGFADLEESGAMRIDAFRFSAREIEEGIAFVETEGRKVMGEGFDHTYAVEIALLVEQSILERKYYNVAEGTTDAVRKLFESLAKGTREHLLRLEAARKG